MSSNYSDKFLLASSLAGDEEAFGKLYDKYVNDIFRFICMRIRSREEAQDLTSEAFLKTWQYVSKKDTKVDNFRALLYRIARNIVIDHYRKSGHEMLAIDEAQFDLIEDKELGIEDKLKHKDDMRVVRKALENLNSEEQELIAMKYIQDLSTKEIAQITGKKSGSVRVALHRAIKRLKQELK